MTGDQVASQVADALQTLADKFGVSVSYFWPRMVAYTFWNNAANVAVELFLIVLGLVSVIMFLFWLKSVKDFDDNRDVLAAALGTLMLLAALAAAVAIMSLPGNFAGMMAPEGKALYDMFAALGGKK